MERSSDTVKNLHGGKTISEIVWSLNERASELKHVMIVTLDHFGTCKVDGTDVPPMDASFMGKLFEFVINRKIAIAARTETDQ